MRRYLLSFLALSLIGCSSDIDIKGFEHKNAEDIYKAATSCMEKKDYSDAIKIFEELEKLHPYSKQSVISQVKLGDCYREMKRFEESISEYEIFIKTHPTHELVPYAVYMLGLVNYGQIPIIERDQEATIKSLECFRTLIRMYPNCKYVPDVLKKIKELRHHLAGREIYISKYYQAHNNYAAAICRLNTVLKLYSDTDHLAEALYRLVECYVAMGFFSEAAKENEMLQKQFANTNWAQYSQKLMKNTKK
jgi:outer membrane protein assembly factor BamD